MAPFFRLLQQLLFERDDFLQRVGVVLPLKRQLAFEIGVALFQPRNVLLRSSNFNNASYNLLRRASNSVSGIEANPSVAASTIRTTLPAAASRTR